jgi:hypothetical protein
LSIFRQNHSLFLGKISKYLQFKKGTLQTMVKGHGLIPADQMGSQKA